MSKNNGVVVNPKKKKKKNKCCGCLLVFLLTFVVLLTGIFAAGWFVGDYYTKQHLDMGIGEVLGVYGDIRTVNKQQLALNEFSDSDADFFEQELKKQLYLKDTVVIPYGEMFHSMFGNLLNGGSAAQAEPVNADAARAPVSDAGILRLRNSFLMEAVRDHGIVTVEGEEAAAANPLVDMIAPLLTRENMDLERLQGHTDETDTRLSFSDKQLGAFLNRMIKTGMNMLPSDTELRAFMFVPRELLGEISIASAKISGTASAPLLSMTAKTNTANIGGMILKQLLPEPFAWAADTLSWLFLPQESYITIDIGLGQESTLSWRLNGLDEAKMQRLNKLITNLSRAMGAEFNLSATLQDYNDTKIKPVVAEINSYMQYDKVSQGKFSTDIVGTAVALSGVNHEKEEPDIVTSSDIYFTMKAFLLAEPEVNEESTFRDQYKVNEGGDAGEIVYKPADFNDGDKYTLVNYQDEFMAELRDKYLIDKEVQFSEIAGLFGIGGSGEGSQDFIGKVKLEGAEMVALAKRPDADRRLVLTDRMLGVLFQEYLGTILGDGQFAAGMDPAISHVTLMKVLTDGAVHNWVEIAFTVDVLKAVGTDGVAGAMLKALLPGERMMQTVLMDITPGQAEEFYGAGSICYNDLTEAETVRLLKVLRAFAPGIDLSQDGLLSQIQPEFRKVIFDMQNLLPGMELGRSEVIDGAYFGGMEAGSIFDLSAEQLSTDTETVTGEEMRKVVLGLHDIDESEFTANKANEEPAAFMREAKDKYYLRDTYQDGDTQKPLDTYDDLMKVLSGNSFTHENIYITPEAGSDKAPLAYDTRDADELRAFLGDRDFGAIMKRELEKRESTQAGNDTLTGFTKIESIRMRPVSGWNGDEPLFTDEPIISQEGLLVMTIAIQTERLMKDADSKYLNMLPKTLYFVLSFRVSPGHVGGKWAEGADPGSTEPLFRFYNYSVRLNDLQRPSEDYDSMMKIITLANGGNNPVEIDETAMEVGRALYEQLGDLRQKLGDGNVQFQSRDGVDGEGAPMIENGFLLGSIFHFLENTDEREGGDPSEKLNAELLQEAVQGMYPAHASYTANQNNYDKDVIVHNPIDTAQSGDDSDSQFGYRLKAGSGIPVSPNPFRSDSEDDPYILVQFDSQKPAAETILTMTFEVKLHEFIEPGQNGRRETGYRGLAPDMMYFTFTVIRSEGGVYTVNQNGSANFTVNGLTDAQRKQVFGLIGYKPDGLTGRVTDCTALLESLDAFFVYGHHTVTPV